MIMVKCECGYIWKYGGTLAMATCPNCSRKTVVDKDEKEEVKEDED